MAEFKAKKRADSKRKDEELIGNPSKRRKFSSQEEDPGTMKEKENPIHTGGKEKLRILRLKMESERARISSLMETRREEDILQGIHTRWKDKEE